ncbi:alpha-amylase/4-alpha-glucanotransferase domain-containing protein [Blastopirellula marina]|uniref:Alpha-amylase n=1 Tax=Blastopirellula marina TaxID=124 RepID=A0A2S8FDE0_9BACT|nr:alpha-amylase/4-alpha-glucanotransferase domain-containing protein [Blastopirellula marina]PQO30177.1 alpha-amylase [Blastopirellula marina]PQO43228.1 alpha-amylase [Blastopirellula marina]PTL42615.1 alpha-amylase [Blastopirellula marina]
MSNSIRLCLVLHNHQPIGNFDGVFEQAYQDSYLPFLDVFDRFSDAIKIGLHTSGPLMEWLDIHHPEYLDRLAAHVRSGRIEIIGGVFYEAILTMIPGRDRVGQIRSYTQWLENRLGATIGGMWMPERVWEQQLTSDIAEAGIRYTLLDDFHFKNAGVQQDDLYGYYVTEEAGQLLSIFPGSERMRYLLPFADPQETIDYLRGIAENHPNSVVVFGDDGEKFGTWPDTKAHVYDRGWLHNFFTALEQNQDWLSTTTLADAVESLPPNGKVFLPEGSYREMTEWVLPVPQQVAYEDLVHELEHEPNWPRIKQFVRGGYWRNFKVRYPETDEMYSRMMSVSKRLDMARRMSGADQSQLDIAQTELYRGQCNCSYWHGAFGGVYLPHLRNAVYNHLIAADNIIDAAIGQPTNVIDAEAGDFNFDARQEIKLVDDKLLALFAPAQGGMMYELDVRSICHNLLATLTRRPEAYHRKVLAGPSTGGGEVASIHDRVVFKQEGLDERLQYDSYARKSLVDHFFDNDVPSQAVANGEAQERGDFVGGVYDAKIRRNPDRIQIQMSREGNAWGVPLKITKGVTLTAGSSTLEIAYLIEGVPQDQPMHFAVEMNFAGLPSGADDRFFHQGGDRIGQLGQRLDLHETTMLGMTDEWLGIDIRWEADQPTSVWTFPIETVSQSEGGFELVHQSVAMMPHWWIQGDKEGRWSVTMKLEIDTALAESRMPSREVAATT